MVHMHGMKTRDRNKSVVHELLVKKGQQQQQAPSPSDSVRKRQASDGPNSIFGPEVVGRKVAVFWRKPNEWFKGKIQRYEDKTKKHFVKYDDGDQAELDLARERFQFLTNPKPGAAPNSSYHGSPKGKEAVGKKVKVYWPAMGRWYVGKVKEYDKPSGKHLIAYQDGEQHLVLLRNEAVRYPHIEAQRAQERALKMRKKRQQQKQQKQKQGSKKAVQSGGGGARALPRGKRVAADYHQANDSSVHSEYTTQRGAVEDPAAKQPAAKKQRSSKSVLQQAEETSHREVMLASSSEVDSTCVSGNSDNEASNSDSLRNVQCPKTPDHDMEGQEQPMEEDHHAGEPPIKCCELVSDVAPEGPAVGAATAAPAGEDKAAEVDGTSASKHQNAEVKAELAKAKAMKAKEIAARKAEEAAKALAAVAAAQKAEAHTDKPQGKDAVGWRLRVWSPEEHKYFKGVVVGFNQGSGEHKLQFDDGRVDSVFLDQQRAKWLNKTLPTQAPLDDKVVQMDVVGKYIRIQRGQEKLVAKVVAFSPLRQKHLILFWDSRHEWSDLGRRSNWEAIDSAQAQASRPSFLPSGKDAVGWRVGVYWPKKERFCQGQVTNVEPTSGHYLVRYDDKAAASDQQQVWLDFKKEDVKWLSRNKGTKSLNSTKSNKGGSHSKKAASATQQGKDLAGPQLDKDAAEIVSLHPEVFAHCRGLSSLHGEKLDVLSNIHNSWGLATPLEELSFSRNKASKASSSALPVLSVDDVWGVKVIEPCVAKDQEKEEDQKQAEDRLALSHRLQVLEFMLEHSSHAEQCLRSAMNSSAAEDQPLLSKEDVGVQSFSSMKNIHALEPTLSNISQFSFPA